MATIMSIFPVIATIISAIFAVMVLRQYLRRRRIYQLVWFVSLVMFTVSAGFETMSEFMGWNVEIYRVYLVLAASQVALMGAGALYLILKNYTSSSRRTFSLQRDFL
ncbi:MAG: hypothetical protein ACXABF_07615 [Candidatus Thorarchaeota archaeon]